MTDAAGFKPVTVYVTYIASTPEKVWQALTDPAFSQLYFFGFAVSVEPKTGGHFALLYPDGRTHISGRVLDWSPLRRFACTWTVEGMPGFAELPECIVTYDIEPAGDAETGVWSVEDVKRFGSELNAEFFAETGCLEHAHVRLVQNFTAHAVASGGSERRSESECRSRTVEDKPHLVRRNRSQDSSVEII